MSSWTPMSSCTLEAAAVRQAEGGALPSLRHLVSLQKKAPQGRVSLRRTRLNPSAARLQGGGFLASHQPRPRGLELRSQHARRARHLLMDDKAALNQTQRCPRPSSSHRDRAVADTNRPSRADANAQPDNSPPPASCCTRRNCITAGLLGNVTVLLQH